MELANTFSEETFNPTPRLKSSSIPVRFISFNINDKRCSYCENYYSITISSQKYCKDCLFEYFKANNISTADTFLDIHTRQCHKSNEKINRSVLEWCEKCRLYMYNHTGEEVLQFKQIIPLYVCLDEYHRQLVESEKDCKLCGKLINKQICPDCYLISSGLIKLTLTKKSFPILYLPWWDASGNCVSCKEKLVFISDCQKWCSYCIIIYTGCRYCLTTNIIFGITDQSQCMKCKRISLITIEMKNIEEYFLEVNIKNNNTIANYSSNINNNSDPLEVYNFIGDLYIPLKPLSDWISYYPQITNLENTEDSFSSAIPIMFIPFNKMFNYCLYCKRKYAETLLFKQKYCKYCLSLYIKYVTNNINIIDMGVYICTKNIGCDNHQPRDLNFCTQNIQEWCKRCSEMSHFNRIINDEEYHEKQKMINTSELSSNRYQISSGWVKSTLTGKVVPILYLSWWDYFGNCLVCNGELFIISDSQKWCSYCVIIYTGCRYCLTTNIIFGITNQSHCKSCKSASLITMKYERAKKYFFEINIKSHNQIVDYVKNIGKNFNLSEIYNFISNLYIPLKPLSNWISKNTNLENAKGFPNMFLPFIPFNNDKTECFYCNRKYSGVTLLFKQKFCEHCLFIYIKIVSNNRIKYIIDVDTYIFTKKIGCDKHKSRDLNFCTRNIQEWCRSCSEILYFNQIVINQKFGTNYFHYIRDYKDCKLCGKSIYQDISSNDFEFKLCSECYLISIGWVESYLTKKPILFLYLPWWDTTNQCLTCDGLLNSKTDCQKWCPICFIIYTGCRYCLTTNIIFGITDESQCRKCNRKFFVSTGITKSKEVNKTYINFSEDVVASIISKSNHQIIDYINKNSNQLGIYSFIKKIYYLSSNSYSPIIKLKTTNQFIFIPFNNYDKNCQYCGNEYFETSLFQKYCKFCLFWYINNMTDENMHLDVDISTNNVVCIEHESRDLNFYTQNIQDWCFNCSNILYFKQIFTNRTDRIYKIYEDRINCKLCGKLIYQQISSQSAAYRHKVEFKMCSNCYQISSGWLETTLVKKEIPVLHLPWWDNTGVCRICKGFLNFEYDCQKWCPNCFTIYTGCRYCLTTNIIFGIIDKSKCKKCDRILLITIDIKDVIEYFLVINTDYYSQIVNYTHVNENSNPLRVYDFINNIIVKNSSKLKIERILYSQITNLVKIARGGFGTIYKAFWKESQYEVVAVKRFLNSQNLSKDLLNEITFYHHYCESFEHIIKYYSITQDPITEEHMIIMEYADGGDLHHYLKSNFTNITWKEKFDIMLDISKGLDSIHRENFIHRDLHSGNILLFNTYHSHPKWKIGDLGLSRPANYTSSDSEIYGVTPYIAPEIFKCAKFSKESDIYSFGIIMWELTTGCKPFTNVEHDDVDFIYSIIDGKRPEITNDTPEDFTNLMKQCWDSDPVKRPLATKVHRTINLLLNIEGDINIFNQAEEIRLQLIKLKMLGPELNEESHPKAIYTSRSLSSLISKSTSSGSSITKQKYITKEYEFDICNIQSYSINLNYSNLIH